MKRFFWLLNLILLFLLIAAVVVVLNLKVRIPTYKAVAITAPQDLEFEAKKLNLTIIYENDLFKTVVTPSRIPSQEVVLELPKIPTPPKKIKIAAPKPADFKFLEPLPVTLTGIVFFNNKVKDRVMILENRTRTEKVYAIDDEIEDAQIISILSDRAILLRSNGQQEILYLSPDAKENKTIKDSWLRIVQEKESIFEINIQEFVKEIPSLSDLIFKFNIKSAVQNSKVIGVKIGNLDKNSLALALGLKQGDIITAINGMPLITTDDRLNAYKEIITLRHDSPVTVDILRFAKNNQLHYVLKNYFDTKKIRAKYAAGDIKTDFTGITIEKTAKEKHEKFEKTLQKAKSKDRENVFKFIKKQ